jgi:transposase
VVLRLVERYKILSESLENITLVFDKGNNSKENLESVYSSPYHFVGSLKLNQVKDLLDISLLDYKDSTNPRLEGVKAYRGLRTIYGLERTILMTFNEDLFITQNQTLFREIKKRTRMLKETASQLSRWIRGEVKKGKKPTIAGVQKNLKGILKGQYMKEIIRTEITEENGLPALSYSVNHEAMENVIRKRFGKTALFTDNDSWSNDEIVLAYRGQFHIEEAFKTMKNPHFVSWSPMWHWTDHNIRVHAFYCVLALTLASLLQRELHSRGIEISIAKAIEELSGISEVALIKKKKKGKQPDPQIVLSKMNAAQQQMFDALQLSHFSQEKI